MFSSRQPSLRKIKKIEKQRKKSNLPPQKKFNEWIQEVMVVILKDFRIVLVSFLFAILFLIPSFREHKYASPFKLIPIGGLGIFLYSKATPSTKPKAVANPTQKWKPYYETVMDDDILDEIKQKEAEERERTKEKPNWISETFKSIFPMELNAQKAMEQEDEASSILRGAFMFHAAADSYYHQNEENRFVSMLIASVGWIFYIIFLADNVTYALGVKMTWMALPRSKKMMIYLVVAITVFECLIYLAPLSSASFIEKQGYWIFAIIPYSIAIGITFALAVVLGRTFIITGVFLCAVSANFLAAQNFMIQDPKVDFFYITWPLHYFGHLSFFIGCLVILATRSKSPKVLSLMESMYGVNMAASTDNVLPEFQ